MDLLPNLSALTLNIAVDAQSQLPLCTPNTYIQQFFIREIGVVGKDEAREGRGVEENDLFTTNDFQTLTQFKNKMKRVFGYGIDQTFGAKYYLMDGTNVFKNIMDHINDANDTALENAKVDAEETVRTAIANAYKTDGTGIFKGRDVVIVMRECYLPGSDKAKAVFTKLMSMMVDKTKPTDEVVTNVHIMSIDLKVCSPDDNNETSCLEVGKKKCIARGPVITPEVVMTVPERYANGVHQYDAKRRLAQPIRPAHPICEYDDALLSRIFREITDRDEAGRLKVQDVEIVSEDETVLKLESLCEDIFAELGNMTTSNIHSNAIVNYKLRYYGMHVDRTSVGDFNRFMFGATRGIDYRKITKEMLKPIRQRWASLFYPNSIA